MELLVCSNIEDAKVGEAVRMHIKHLSYRSFITKFGFQFLHKLYKDWLARNNGILVIAIDQDKLLGFVMGIKDKGALFEPIFTKPFKYFHFILKGILKTPASIPKLMETLLYKKKSDHNINSELLVIVTEEGNRSKGLGSMLVKQLEQEFIKQNISEYTVTVHSEMKQSNNFYTKNGMTLLNSFKLYGVMWNEYMNTIKDE